MHMLVLSISYVSCCCHVPRTSIGVFQHHHVYGKPILSASTRWTVDKRECRGSYAVWKLGSHSHNRAVESAPDEDMSRGMQNLGFCPRPNLEHGKRYPVRNSDTV